MNKCILFLIITSCIPFFTYTADRPDQGPFFKNTTNRPYTIAVNLKIASGGNVTDAERRRIERVYMVSGHTVADAIAEVKEKANLNQHAKVYLMLEDYGLPEFYLPDDYQLMNLVKYGVVFGKVDIVPYQKGSI